jgi:hypothetical protein
MSFVGNYNPAIPLHGIFTYSRSVNANYLKYQGYKARVFTPNYATGASGVQTRQNKTSWFAAMTPIQNRYPSTYSTLTDVSLLCVTHGYNQVVNYGLYKDGLAPVFNAQLVIYTWNTGSGSSGSTRPTSGQLWPRGVQP